MNANTTTPTREQLQAKIETLQAQLKEIEAEEAAEAAAAAEARNTKLFDVAVTALNFAAREDLLHTIIEFPVSEGATEDEFPEGFAKQTVISVTSGCERKGFYSNGYPVDNPNPSYHNAEVIEVRVYVPRSAVADVIAVELGDTNH